ncbi:hypothetical protein [Conexibacter woesei]|uniref:hypothetical protein n=1 Tax=Conexibacter woesei TaxID=191495 RepID=UPI000402EB5C|nr:hypothetical protein [Conexibacter woesei]
MTVRRLAPALLAAAALLAVPAGASARAPTCPAKAGTLFHNSYGRAWHARGSLYSCTTVYGHKRVVRLGPWKSGSKLAWEPTHAAWSVPAARGDRIWAGSTENGKRWLLGTRALGSSEARVQRLFVYDSTAAWVTKAGAVVFALEQPQADPEAIGALPSAPAARSHLAVAGTFGALSPTDLGRTVRLDSANEDGDECGGAADYRVTFAPDPAAPSTRVGITWNGGWTRPFCG